MAGSKYVGMELRVEYMYDPESENWCFVVPSLGIIGGAQTREEAEQQAIDAITFTLESENNAAPLPRERFDTFTWWCNDEYRRRENGVRRPVEQVRHPRQRVNCDPIPAIPRLTTHD